MWLCWKANRSWEQAAGELLFNDSRGLPVRGERGSVPGADSKESGEYLKFDVIVSRIGLARGATYNFFERKLIMKRFLSRHVLIGLLIEFNRRWFRYVFVYSHHSQNLLSLLHLLNHTELLITDNFFTKKEQFYMVQSIVIN